MEEKERGRREEGRAIALECLMAICGDGEARHADRIAAAKLLLENMGDGGQETIAVVMEGVPKEFLV